MLIPWKRMVVNDLWKKTCGRTEMMREIVGWGWKQQQNHANRPYLVNEGDQQCGFHSNRTLPTTVGTSPWIQKAVQWMTCSHDASVQPLQMFRLKSPNAHGTTSGKTSLPTRHVLRNKRRVSLKSQTISPTITSSLPRQQQQILRRQEKSPQTTSPALHHHHHPT
jgi:hypothetical protein